MKKALSAQEMYVRSVKRTDHKVRFWRVVLCIAFFAAWEWCTRREIIDSFIFSSPSKLARCFQTLLTSEGLAGHIGIT